MNIGSFDAKVELWVKESCLRQTPINSVDHSIFGFVFAISVLRALLISQRMPINTDAMMKISPLSITSPVFEFAKYLFEKAILDSAFSVAKAMRTPEDVRKTPIKSPKYANTFPIFVKNNSISFLAKIHPINVNFVGGKHFLSQGSLENSLIASVPLSAISLSFIYTIFLSLRFHIQGENYPKE